MPRQEESKTRWILTKRAGVLKAGRDDRLKWALRAFEYVGFNDKKSLSDDSLLN